MKQEPEKAIMIISRDADSFASELSDLPVTVADSVERAIALHGEESILLGEPDIVAAALPALDGIHWVQSTWAGLVPLIGAARGGTVVTGVKDVFGTQMAEYTLGYMLANELRLLDRVEHQARHSWWQADTGGLEGRTLGVMGTGSIGTAIARRADWMGMHVLGFSRSGNAGNPFESVYPAEHLPAFLARLDYLVSVLPDTPETTDLLDAAAFEALPDHAVFINVGRGNVVVDQDLVSALNQGHLAGAVLDVFREEPLPENHPFWTTRGLLMTAHVAARSYPADIAAIFRENYRRYLAGEPLNFVLDPDRGY